MESFSTNVEAAREQQWQAHAHVWNHIMRYISSMSLKCAVELGVADIIHTHGKPITFSDLAAKLSIPTARTSCFRRLMRLLVHSGFFAQTTGDGESEEAFGLTASSALLVKEQAEGASPLLFFVLDQALVTPWQGLSGWLRGNAAALTPFEAAHGMEIFEATKQDTEFNSLLHAAMASDARLVAQMVVRECGGVFRGLSSLVDVGGGTGTMAMAVAEAFPEIKCTVFDLPHVVAPLEGNAKVEVVGGDMFDQIPPADAALLKWVLHDWSDDDCIRILQRCKEAIPAREEGGKVIIVEMVVNVDNCVHELAETQLLFDMLMMAHTTGKQRTEAEWRKLFISAGFSDYKIINALGIRSLIEVYY